MNNALPSCFCTSVTYKMCGFLLRPNAERVVAENISAFPLDIVSSFCEQLSHVARFAGCASDDQNIFLFFFFKVPRNWTSVGLQQDPHETIGNGLNTVTESPLQVSAASGRYTTRGDERGLCFCQRLWGEKSHELFCQWSFPRLRTKDRSCHLGLAQKNYN